MIERLKTWWKKHRRRYKITRVLVVNSMTAIPERIGTDLYLVRKGDFCKRVVLNCPCGCKRRIDLNMVRTHKPSWTAKLEKGTISLNPSIWLPEDPCQSHFFIKYNTIEWVN